VKDSLLMTLNIPVIGINFLPNIAYKV